MRKLVSLLILLLILYGASASQIQYAEISIDVINRPPEIISLNMLPEKPYYDSVISCDVIVNDEDPESVVMEYVWYRNNELSDMKTKQVSGFSAGDVIKCEAVAIDSSKQRSSMKEANVTILETPVRVALMMPVLKTFGVDISAKELEQETSLAGITGMVTGQRQSSLSLWAMLLVVAIILAMLNIFAFAIRVRNRKTKFPKLDF